ncbi:SRPBCC domain-containing protein [Parachryseolinea silvisoli]|uniref:SRPBCC domain-containing protein n=1 Tax=Parachryseolinea silvisoli TaxID=2873601 RepID=UPI002265895E|nr:SRPBCC domain-containing protein [Parachryseolinea silvisoli]MCD9019018.1 SRPBCC domain-containing protein [Parachryseolinea silvisoli]
MKAPLVIKNTISIQASPSEVWDALVNPVKTKQYMFGCETVSDWKVGSQLLWTGVFDGKELVAVKGEILEIQPGKRLVYTTIDPNSTIDDVSENYLRVTYDLKPDNGYTVLHVEQGDYAIVAEGERRYQEAFNGGEGWNPILMEIKKLVETR